MSRWWEDAALADATWHTPEEPPRSDAPSGSDLNDEAEAFANAERRAQRERDQHPQPEPPPDPWAPPNGGVVTYE